MKKLLSTALFLFSIASHAAGDLEFKFSAQQIENSPIAASVTLDKNVHLTSVGSALRVLSSSISTTKVYVGSVFVSNPEKFVNTSERALDSIRDMSTFVMRMDFVNQVGVFGLYSPGLPVPSSMAIKTFSKLLTKNGVDVENNVEAKAFLNSAKEALGGWVSAGDVCTMIVQKDEGRVTLRKNDGAKVTMEKVSLDFQIKIASMWLGEPVDSELATFRDDLLKAGAPSQLE